MVRAYGSKDMCAIVNAESSYLKSEKLMNLCIWKVPHSMTGGRYSINCNYSGFSLFVGSIFVK